MGGSRERPPISVVIPTHDRAELLAAALESLETQTLPSDDYEVLVVDDGSTDETPAVCGRFERRLWLRYVRLEHSGIAAAKNIGIFAASGRLLFFFDDDDVAHADLLRQHVVAHSKWPAETACVLGYTTWAPWLQVTDLMHYVTEVGQLLFSYRSLRAEQALDFTYFWGGRSSCKRSFLARHGAFRQDFEFGCEDIELGYRLSKFGLKVSFERQAVSFMNRGVTLDEFCRRCERQGRAQFIFNRLHRDPVVEEYCQTRDAIARWRAVEPRLAGTVARIRQLESAIEQDRAAASGLRPRLWELYKAVFTAYKLKGIVEMSAGDGCDIPAGQLAFSA